MTKRLLGYRSENEQVEADMTWSNEAVHLSLTGSVSLVLLLATILGDSLWKGPCGKEPNAHKELRPQFSSARK